jgi:competence protein ComEC
MVSIIRSFFAAAGLIVLASAAYAEQVTPDERVQTRVIIRHDPSTESSIVGRLLVGQSLELARDLPGWYEVRLPDGTLGYVSKAWTRPVGVGQPEVAFTSGSSFKVHVIDVGTGLAVFIEGKDFAMLYDGGSQDDLAKGKDNRIVAYIKTASPTLKVLNHLVLSHPHKDHVELLPDIFDQFEIKNVWDSGTVNLTVGYCKFLSKVSQEVGVKYHDAISSGQIHSVPCKAGDVSIREAEQMSDSPVTLGQNAKMTILYRDADKHPDPNENSVVVRLDLGQRHILLAGDAEGGERRAPSSLPDSNSIEEKLLNCCAADLRADVLIVGHHGSKSSSRSSFIDAVGAKVFVISSGPHTYGKNHVVLPDGEIVSLLEARGKVLRTDIDDEECMASESKIGPGADESPGGCSNVVLEVEANGVLTAGYSQVRD